ncbi:MAG: metal-dependent hydrolase [Candidatus Bathyarchaeia archaeon]
MLAVGHLAFGYLLAKICQKALKTDLNLPLVFLLSVLPDIDLLIPAFSHRSMTHSIILLTILFAPVLLIYRKKGIPYFAAMAQHVLLGDYLVGGGVQIFWPINRGFYGYDLSLVSLVNILLEFIGFVIAVVVMFFSRDLHVLLFKPKKENFILLLPCGAIFASMLLFWSSSLPVALIVSHFVFLAIFVVAVISTFKTFFSHFRQL